MARMNWIPQNGYSIHHPLHTSLLAIFQLSVTKLQLFFRPPKLKSNPKKLQKNMFFAFQRSSTLDPGPGEFLGGLQLALHVFFHHLQLGHHSLLPWSWRIHQGSGDWHTFGKYHVDCGVWMVFRRCLHMPTILESSWKTMKPPTMCRIYIYIYTYRRMCGCVHIYIHTHIWVYIYIYIFYVSIYIYTY